TEPPRVSAFVLHTLVTNAYTHDILEIPGIPLETEELTSYVGRTFVLKLLQKAYTRPPKKNFRWNLGTFPQITTMCFRLDASENDTGNTGMDFKDHELNALAYVNDDVSGWRFMG
ncbi:unnamed protein product, partial [Ectocarpus sp. 8 AP-2014]